MNWGAHLLKVCAIERERERERERENRLERERERERVPFPKLLHFVNRLCIPTSL